MMRRRGETSEWAEGKRERRSKGGRKPTSSEVLTSLVQEQDKEVSRGTAELRIH